LGALWLRIDDKTDPISVFLGRSFIYCRYPCAAWRRLPASGRAFLLAAYVGVSYVTVLALLLIA
jgi:hypothetical protein